MKSYFEEEFRFTRNTFGDEYLYAINREEFNQIGANATFKSRLKPALFAENHLHVVIGSDSGLLPGYILSKGLPSGSRYLFIEPEDLWHVITEKCNIDEYRMEITTPEDPFSSLEKKTEQGIGFYFSCGQVLLHKSLAAESGNFERYQELYVELDETITRANFTLQGNANLIKHYQNMVINSAEAVNDASIIKDVCKGYTAIVLAAGPSLMDHINWIRVNRKDVIVIAISRICGILKDCDLEPDIIATIDPIEYNFTISKQMLHFTGSLLAHKAHAYHHLISSWTGKKIVIGNRLPWVTRLDSGFINTSYIITVTNLAIDIADWIGASQIILIGVDLCQGNTGGIHVQDKTNRNPPAISTNLVEITTNSGETAFSTTDYIESSKGVSAQAAFLVVKGVRCINPTPWAMRLDHVEHLSTNDILVQPQQQTARHALSGAVIEHGIPEYRDALRKEINRKKRETLKLKKLITQGRHLLLSIEQQRGGTENPYTQLRVIINKLQSSPLSEIVKKHNWREFAVIFSTLDNQDNSNRTLSHEKYFDAYGKGLDQVIELIKFPLEKIDLLQREENHKESVRELMDAWRVYIERLPIQTKSYYTGYQYDKQFWLSAIAYRWKQTKYGGSDAENEYISEMARAFESEIDLPRSITKESGSRALLTINLNKAIIAANKFFLGNNHNGIKHLIGQVMEYPEEIASSYLHLLLGLLAEAENDPCMALNEYREILADENFMGLDQALRRISGICLERGDYENAAYAIESLATLSNRYLNSYAEILYALGYIEASINTFKLYLDAFPNDLQAARKYLALLIDGNMKEDALSVCRQYMANHPEESIFSTILESIVASSLIANHDGGGRHT